MSVKALLLAGGLGTRLRPLTDTVPKCLIDVGGRPILDYWLNALMAANIREVLVNTHHLPEAVRAYIDTRNSVHDIQLIEAFEPELLGSAGTVHANLKWADAADEIVVIYADNLSNIDLSALLAFHHQHDDPMTMVLFRTPYPEKCGIAVLDAHNHVTEFVEKPDQPQSDLANAGIYVLDPDAWREIADMNVFDFGFDVLPAFVGRMRGFVHQGYHRDIGTPESLAQARADIRGIFS